MGLPKMIRSMVCEWLTTKAVRAVTPRPAAIQLNTLARKIVAASLAVDVTAVL